MWKSIKQKNLQKNDEKEHTDIDFASAVYLQLQQ